MSNKPIILYCYPTSPYAKRIEWYLTLRNIPFKKCVQPNVLPRPDIARLGIVYRRIPLMAVGRDVYLDTRLMLAKLEVLVAPDVSHPSLTPQTGDQKALVLLLQRLVVETGLFRCASASLPLDMPQFQDPKYLVDRADLVGVDVVEGVPSPFSREVRAAQQPAALVEIRGYLEILESTLLADGRTWILGTGNPSLGDIEAVWILHWVANVPGSLPDEYRKAFPKVFAWIARFSAEIETKKQQQGDTGLIQGDEAASLILGSDFIEMEGRVDTTDAVASAEALGKGDRVRVWPADYGSRYKDEGGLVSFTPEEVVIETQADTGTVVRVHAPRHGFAVQKVR